uniref:Si:dkey-14o18.2 n=1 Tax=Gasterosteus aculeatus TaxID=69293 RepID=G3NBA7_GASAC
KFVCTPIPPEADPSCYSPPSVPHGPSSNGQTSGHNGSSRRGVMSDEAKATILHLRESLVRQKETILDQRETIRELTAKLTLCEGFGGHQKAPSYGKHSSFSPEQTGKTLQTLKERLENLQDSLNLNARNSSSSYSSSLRELLQRKITALEEQLDSYYRDHHDDHRLLRNLRGAGHGKLETVLSQLHHGNTDHEKGHSSGKKLKTPNAFLLNFPVKTNYMYAKMKRPPVNEIFALTICLWLKAGAGPGLGTPFSYAAPGQANELVLIEWGSNPMELLICDKAVTLPITMTDGKWHHVCITWTTRDGVWEAYQDGVKKGSGQNLSAWRPIEPGGAFILGQEQDTMGGRFDVTQSFVGELSDLQFWSRVLSASEISTQATCGGHLVGDVMSWSEESVELHGGLVQVPFDPC